MMSNVKTAVRIIIALMLFCGAVNGQVLNRRQMVILQRQQKQLDQQQELLEKQLLSQVCSFTPIIRPFHSANPLILIGCYRRVLRRLETRIYRQ